MLIASGELHRLARAEVIVLPLRLHHVLLALCAVMLAMGLVQAFVPRLLADELLKNRLENALEWNVGLAFTLFFIVLAWLWRRTRFTVRLSAGS